MTSAAVIGYPIRRIDDVCDVVNGGTPKTGEAEFWDGSHQWITPAEMGKRASPYVDATERTLSDAGLDELSGKLLPPKSVILSTRAPIGHLVINTVPMAFNQGCKGLVPQKELNYKFLYYYLYSIREELDAMGTGATFRELSSGRLREIRVPLPPLPEQHRIVGILDGAFAGIATAKANAEENLRNAREVFESEVAFIFRDLMSRVSGRPLGDAVESISTGPFGSLLHKSDYEVDGIPLVNPINIDGDEIIPDSRKAVGAQTAKRLGRYSLMEGDVVTARRGEIGRCASIGREQAGWICGTGSFFIRPGAGIDSRFLTHLIRSQPYRSQLERLSGRATMPSIGNDDLAGLVVHVPTLTEQKEIETCLTRLKDEIERVEAIYQQKLAALDALKKSLLHQAFSGQL